MTDDSGLYTPSDPQDFPTIPRHESEELRQQLRERARSDLYFLCKGVLGYNKLIPRVHGSLCKFLTSEEILSNFHRRMIQLPRDHFKTTVATISDSIQLIVNDPEIRILLVAQSAANAENFLQEIKNHFRSNEMFKWLFPELIPENFNKARWNRQEMQIPRDSFFREPTVDTIGSRGAVESRHYDVIKADDIIGQKEYDSDAEMQKTIEWSSGLESLLNESWCHIDFIGTRWKRGDVYDFIEEFYSHREDPQPIGPHAQVKGEIAIYRRGARAENGEPIFPEIISRQFLDRLQRERPERYAAQYANNPKESGVNQFSEDWLRFWKIPESYATEPEECPYTGEVFQTPGRILLPRHLYDGGKEAETVPVSSLDIRVLYDPSSGEGSSKQAMLVTGALHRNSLLTVILLETHIGFYPADEAIWKMLSIDRRYSNVIFSIEKYGLQGTIKHNLRGIVESNFLPMPAVREFPPSGVARAQQAKDDRIRGLQPMFRAGQVWIREDMNQFLDEYTFYPNSKTRDALDALAQGPILWGVSWNEEHREDLREREEAIIARIGRDGYSVRPETREERRLRTRRSERVRMHK